VTKTKSVPAAVDKELGFDPMADAAHHGPGHRRDVARSGRTADARRQRDRPSAGDAQGQSRGAATLRWPGPRSPRWSCRQGGSADLRPARWFPAVNLLLIVANFAVFIFYELPHLVSGIVSTDVNNQY
jgi:hypothetical protein